MVATFIRKNVYLYGAGAYVSRFVITGDVLGQEIPNDPDVRYN